jgi:hypothetical protein
MRRIALISLSFVLVGCGATPLPPTMPADPVAETGTVIPQAKHAVYTEYTEHNQSMGEKSVLFFADAKDPFSQSSDKVLQAIYGSGSAALSTYRLDFATAKGAELQYGVFVSDTFVLVGPTGEKLQTLLHPTSSDLLHLLAPTPKK